jgi:Glycosyltransferase 61
MAQMREPVLRANLAPYTRLFRRIFQGAGTPSSVAVRQDILCPEETSTTRLPVYLNGQLERVTSSTGHQSLKAEIDGMLASTATHAPTIAYHIKDAILYDGSVYAKNMRYYLAPRNITNPRSEIRHFKIAGLASTAVGQSYFGHWLRDDCIQYLLAEQTGSPICARPPAEFHHQTAYADYFRQDWTPVDRAIVDDLIIYQDFAQNSLKRARYELLSKRIAEAFPAAGTREKLVYLRRGATGAARLVQNETSLLDVLQKRGFDVIDVSAPAQEILRDLRQAKLVVSVEGSQITHCAFALEPGCALLVLQPPDRFTAVHRHWTSWRGIRFGFVVGQKDDSGYLFSPDEILKTAELLLQ